MLGDLLSPYRKKPPIPLITFSHIKEAYKEGLPLDLYDDDNVWVTRIHADEDSVSLRLNMKRGAKIELCMHDCYEVLIVYQGSCVDNISGKRANAKEELIIKPYTPHEIVSDSQESVIYISFNKKI